jgi:hypothetical protein
LAIKSPSSTPTTKSTKPTKSTNSSSHFLFLRLPNFGFQVESMLRVLVVAVDRFTLEREGGKILGKENRQEE